MRLALWSTGYCRGFGGSEQMVNALLRRFHRDGLEAILVADGSPANKLGNPHFPPLPKDVELYVDSFPNPLLCIRRPTEAMGSLFRYLQAALKLCRFLRKRAPDIVHLHLVTVDVFLLILCKYLFNYQLVITFRGSDLTVIRRSRLARLKVLAALRCADAVTSVSEDMVRCLRNNFRDRRAFCIPNGIDFAELSSVVANVQPAIPPGHFVYGGRLHPDKRVPLLVELFGECIRMGITQNLYIIGDGEERGAVADYISRNGLERRIFLLGSMKRYDVLSALAQARCLLLTSAAEGCPNIVLEAMSLGVPVVAPAIGGVPELVVHGENGYLFPADRPESAMEYIVRIARDDRVARDMGRRGAELAREKFDLTLTTGKYIELYRSLLSGPGTEWRWAGNPNV